MRDKKFSLRAFLRSRGTRRAAVSLTLTVLFIAAVVLVNIIMAVVTDRHPLYLDVTANSSYELQDVTVEYTATVDKPVNIYVLQKEADFENGDSANYQYYIQANKLIRAIAASSDRIDLHYIDLPSNPTFTADYPAVDWTQSHIVLVTCGDNYRAVDLTDMFSYDQEQYYYYGTYVINGQHIEQALLTAILNVTADEKTKVTLLSGQGEQDMSAFTTLLGNNAYEVETVSLLNGKIADDSEFVIIFDPEVDIDADIAAALSDWLYHDGAYGRHLFYFPNDQHDVSEYPNLNALIADYGMALRYGYIYENDESKLVPGYNHYISVYDYADDTYTAGLRSAAIPVVMSLTMPVTITDEDAAASLLNSSDKAFFFPKDLDEEAVADFDPKPETLCGAAIGARNDGTEDGKSSSVVVIGSYDAVSSNYLSVNSYNNAAYFVGLFNALSDKDDIGLVIEGKDPSSSELGVTSAGDIAFASYMVRFIIPGGVLIAGLIVWIRRRHR